MIIKPLPILKKSEILRIFLVFIIIGFFTGKIIWQTEYFLLIGGLLLVLSLVYKKFWWGVVSALLLANFYGQWRNFNNLEISSLIPYDNQVVQMSGEVINFPDIRENDIRVFVKTDTVNNKNIKETVLLILSRDDKVSYGDKLNFEGKITTPRNFNTFDYSKYLLRFGVKRIVKNPKSVEKVCHQCGGNFVLRNAAKIRDWLADNLNKNLPMPHSQIAMGILLGVKHELPDFVKDDFQKSGLQHILVVSGFNVTVLIVFISLIFKKFGRKINFIITSLALIFFVAMTGGEAPIIRAAIMGGIVGFAAASGRFSESRNLILLSIFLIGLINPVIIQADIGFFLSAAATIGIILGVPILEKLLKFIPNFLEIRTLLTVTIAAQVAVLPILGLYFGNFSVIGLLSNLLTEPLIPLGMLFSFIISISGFLPLIITKIIAIPAFVVLESLLQIARLFGDFPVIEVSPIFSYSLLIIFGVLMFWAIFSRWFEHNFLENSDCTQ